MLVQIFVSGTWKSDKAARYRAQGLLLGQRLALAGHDLACGPGTGVARHVIDGYRSVAERGRVRYYLPDAASMREAGEAVEEGADDIEHTEFDYPMRNTYQVSRCQGLFVLTGGDGTLEEILPAIIDYGQPVAIVEGAGTAARAMRLLIDIYPAWTDQVLFGGDVAALIEPFLDRVNER